MKVCRKVFLCLLFLYCATVAKAWRKNGPSKPATIRRYSYRVLGPVTKGPITNKPCSQPKLIRQPLDINRFSGRWYAYSQIPSAFSPPGSKCIAANYLPDGSGGFKVRNSQQFSNGQYVDICGVAFLDDKNGGRGRFKVKLGPFPPGDFWLVDTDYTSYAVVYSCSGNDYSDYEDDNDDEEEEVNFGWILTRDSKPDVETVEKAESLLGSAGIDLSDFSLVSQGGTNNCTYEPDDGTDCLSNNNSDI